MTNNKTNFGGSSLWWNRRWIWHCDVQVDFGRFLEALNNPM